MSSYSFGEFRELSSGLIIAGAYATKIRRTLFAQLRELSRQDKDFSKEIARASAELNVVLYNILVNELRMDKGDVVRIRINYSIDPRTRKITWDYSSLRVEAYRRIPDEKVIKVVQDVVVNKLSRILEEYRLAPRVAEEAVRAFEVAEEKLEEVPPPHVALAVPVKLADLVSSLDVIGETVDGGILVKFTGKEGQSIGIATVTPSDNEVVIDAIVIHEGISKRYLVRLKGRLEQFIEDPLRVIGELEKATPVELSKEQAESLIREKMQSLL